MFHARVVLIPVWTTAGEALSVPNGTDGLVAPCANACGAAKTPMARTMADTVEMGLAFMMVDRWRYVIDTNLLVTYIYQLKRVTYRGGDWVHATVMKLDEIQ